LVGSPIEFSINPDVYAEDVLVRTPGYPAAEEIAISAVPVEGADGFRVRWELTEQVGVYQFVLRTLGGEEEVRVVAVNPDTAESNLRSADEGELRAAMPDVPFVYISDLSSLSDVDGDARREYWRAILVAVVLLLMGEQFLGWWFGRRAS
jgi:hypothetical protein